MLRVLGAKDMMETAAKARFTESVREAVLSQSSRVYNHEKIRGLRLLKRAGPASVFLEMESASPISESRRQPLRAESP